MKLGKNDPIYALAKQVAELTAQMEKLGLFTHHRDITECEQCGLFEDVDITGYLFVYRDNDPENIADLRFIEREDGCVVCPLCGQVVLEPEEE